MIYSRKKACGEAPERVDLREKSTLGGRAISVQNIFLYIALSAIPVCDSSFVELYIREMYIQWNIVLSYRGLFDFLSQEVYITLMYIHDIPLFYTHLRMSHIRRFGYQDPNYSPKPRFVRIDISLYVIPNLSPL